MKCDETKPNCNRCVSAGRVCRSSRSPSPQAGDPSEPTRQVQYASSDWLATPTEKRSFQFFLTHAGRQLGGFFEGQFWSREVLQAAVRYPAIRHLVVALGVTYEGFERSGSGTAAEEDIRFALQQCNHSIKYISQLKDSATASDKPDEAMGCTITVAILFTIFNCLQGQTAQAIKHIRSGLRVLQALESYQEQHKKTSALAFPVPLAQLRLLLTGLYAQVRAMINDEAFEEWDRDPLSSTVQPVARYMSLSEARCHVESLFNSTLAYLQKTTMHPLLTIAQIEAAKAQHDQLSQALRASCKALDDFVSRQGASAADEKAVAVLRLYHILLSIRLEIGAFQENRREAAFDQLEPGLEKMLEYAKFIIGEPKRETEKPGKIICSSGLGVVMPLHMVAARCRNPTVRKEAVDLLLRARRRDGLWDSTLAGRVVSTTIELEELAAKSAGLSTESKGSYRVADDARIRDVKIHFDGDRTARLVFITVGQWRENQEGLHRILEW